MALVDYETREVMAIKRGDVVEVTTAGGDEHVKMRALGAPVQGQHFPVLWVCTEAEYQSAEGEGREPSGLPWPVASLPGV
jgi:bifunctional DNA-binding transcriptional regulator/antitoxin component of YhaV-PrlF toxin-antitoxin module